MQPHLTSQCGCCPWCWWNYWLLLYVIIFAYIAGTREKKSECETLSAPVQHGSQGPQKQKSAPEPIIELLRLWRMSGFWIAILFDYYSRSTASFGSCIIMSSPHWLINLFFLHQGSHCFFHYYFTTMSLARNWGTRQELQRRITKTVNY